MIDLITRVRDNDLYRRLIQSAFKTADNAFGVFMEDDKDGLPKLAETYNRLGGLATGKILCFVHDDIEFLSDGWDTAVSELFDEYPVDILGVVGSDKYEGGKLFAAGPAHAFGHFCCEVDGAPYVKVLSRSFRYKPVRVVDGMIMFCRRSFFEQNGFDETFDQLFFYDTDLCLRGNVGVTCNVLVKHSKPKELYGKYPAAMNPIEVYEDRFNRKHGFVLTPVPVMPVCAMAKLEDFEKRGQNDIFDGFMEKYASART